MDTNDYEVQSWMQQVEIRHKTRNHVMQGITFDPKVLCIEMVTLREAYLRSDPWIFSRLSLKFFPDRLLD